MDRIEHEQTVLKVVKKTPAAVILASRYMVRACHYAIRMHSKPKDVDEVANFHH